MSEFSSSKVAMEEFKLDDNLQIDMTRTSDRKDQKYWDPSIDNQNYCLVSFVASQGATPDKNGIFGFMKIRGVFQRLNEAQDKAEWLIRNVDSYTPILTTFMGKPFPLSSDNKKYVRETNEVDIQNQLSKTVSDNIKAKKTEEKKVKEDILQREKKLLTETEKGEDPIDQYTTLRVKKAQLTFTYIKTLEKIEEMKNNIIKAREDIAKMEETDENFAKDYYQKFVDARTQVGLDTTSATSNDNFIRYLVEDADLGF